MSLRLAIFASILLTLKPVSGLAQTSVSDATAVAILTQSLTASGVGVSPGLAFTANGTVTYFWGGEQVQGPATLRGQGHDQYRLDADLSNGRRSVALNRRSGARQDADGKLTEIPYHNTLGLGVPSLPYASMATALGDPAHTISYVGLAESGGRQLHQVRVVRNYPKDRDPDGTLSGLSRADYFVDALTSLVTKTEDETHPVQTVTESYSHEVEFDGYTAINGVAVPTIMREKVGGATIWELRLSSINFDTNHTDEDFSLR